MPALIPRTACCFRFRAEAQHPAIPAFAALARQRKAWILIGSIGVKAADGRVFNRSFMLDPSGEIVARYDKLHMYDVELGDGHTYKELATIAPGSEAVLSPSPGGLLGMSVCYDLRFPGLIALMARPARTSLPSRPPSCA